MYMKRNTRNPLSPLSLLLAALLFCAVLAGCGGSSYSSASSTAVANGAYQTEAAYDMVSTESMAMDSGSVDATLDPGAVTDRKIVYTADVSMESTAFDEARAALLAIVEDCGAYLEYSSQRGDADDQDRRLNYTVRVPAANYRDFLSAIGEAGNVLSISEQAEDITSSYIDVEARIDALKIQRDRLNELIAKAETTADLLEIERQLSEVQYELESYTRQLRSMESQVSYSTVSIALHEVATLTPTTTTFFSRLGRAFTDGWDGFVAFLADLLVFLVGIWPLLILVGIGVVIWRVTSPLRAASRARRKAKHEAKLAARNPAYRYDASNAGSSPEATATPDDSEPKPKY